MTIMRILEKNGIDNTNIDGAGFNRFCAGDRDGIVKGRLNECAIAVQGNALTIGTGEMLVSGFRVVIDTPTTFTMSSTPTSAQRYQVIAELVVDGNSEPTFSLRTQLVAELKQDALFATESGVGTYQVELCKFTHTTSGNIDDLLRTIDVITGGSGTGGGVANVGDVTTKTLESGMEAEVDVEARTVEGQQYLDFNFGIPKGNKGADGITPHIGDNKHWYIGDTDTGTVAEGRDGTDGADGADGQNGADGITPHIGANKHWYIGEEDTGIVAEGKDGATPEIGENGNWFISGQDTGKPSKGADGAAATVQVGETTTLPAGSEATVENVGDEHNAVFNFGIPKGADGASTVGGLVGQGTLFSGWWSNLTANGTKGKIPNFFAIDEKDWTGTTLDDPSMLDDFKPGEWVTVDETSIPGIAEGDIVSFVVRCYGSIEDGVNQTNPTRSLMVLAVKNNNGNPGQDACILSVGWVPEDTDKNGVAICDLGEVTLQDIAYGSVKMGLADIYFEGSKQNEVLPVAENPVRIRLRLAGGDGTVYEFDRTSLKIGTNDNTRHAQFERVTLTDDSFRAAEQWFVIADYDRSRPLEQRYHYMIVRMTLPVMRGAERIDAWQGVDIAHDLGTVTLTDGAATIQIPESDINGVAMANVLRLQLQVGDTQTEIGLVRCSVTGSFEYAAVVPSEAVSTESGSACVVIARLHADRPPIQLVITVHPLSSGGGSVKTAELPSGVQVPSTAAFDAITIGTTGEINPTNISDFVVGDIIVIPCTISGMSNGNAVILGEVKSVGSSNITYSVVAAIRNGTDGNGGAAAEVTKSAIANALGCTEAQLDTLVALAKKVTVSGSDVKFATGTVLKSSYFDAVD